MTILLLLLGNANIQNRNAEFKCRFKRPMRPKRIYHRGCFYLRPKTNEGHKRALQSLERAYLQKDVYNNNSFVYVQGGGV